MVRAIAQPTNPPTRRDLKLILRQDMATEYWRYTGHFRLVYPQYPKIKLMDSPELTSAHFRLATGHINVGMHRKHKNMPGPYGCRLCDHPQETLWHLLKHCNYGTRHHFLDLVRGSKGTQVDRLKLFRLVAKLRL